MSTVISPGPVALPEDLVHEGDFVAACKEAPDSLVYFLLNVGDGDTQLVLLPKDPSDESDTRRALVIDVGTTNKLPRLIESLIEAGLLPERERGDTFAVVIGSHPHDDHIGGMPQFLERFQDHIVEYWDSGYYHPTAAYVETMVILERLRKSILVTQPTSGMTRFIGSVKLSIVTPGVSLRNRFDTYGVNINDASIAVKIEFPATRIVQQENDRDYVRPPEPWALLLGADAQTTSWAQATVDFPERHSDGDHGGGFPEADGLDWLRAHIFKVPHHASKHGVNIELVERIQPKLSLISSVGGAGRYHFPHHLAIEAIREGIEPTTSGQVRSGDHELGIYYTADRLEGTDQDLGTIALIVPPKRRSKAALWRLRDRPSDAIDLSKAVTIDTG